MARSDFGVHHSGSKSHSLGHLAVLVYQLMSHFASQLPRHMPASSRILTSKGPGVWGDEYQGAWKPLGQVAGSQNNTHPRAGSLSAEVHLQKRLPGLAGGRDNSLGADFFIMQSSWRPTCP